MQQEGISVDKQALVDYSKVLGTKILVLEKEIYEAKRRRVQYQFTKADLV